MEKKQTYIILFISIFLLLIAAVLFYRFETKGSILNNNGNTVNDDYVSEDTTNSQEQNVDENVANPDTNVNDSSITQDINDTINNINQQMSGLDGNTDFSDFGAIE